MIALSASVAPAPARPRMEDIFGTAALNLRERTLRRLGVGLDDMMGKRQRGPAIEARQEVAFLLWTECLHLSLSDVAKLIGRSDHSGAIAPILAGARKRGIKAARVSDLRAASRDPVDWTKLAYAAAFFRDARGQSLRQASGGAGISLSEWRKIERGGAVSAGTMLRLCRHIEADPMGFLAGDTHETTVKHGGHDDAPRP